MKTILLVIAFAFGGLAHSAQPDERVVITQTDVSATGTSTSHLAANLNRNYLLIQNKGSASVYVKFGSAHSGTEGVVIVAGGNYEPVKVPTQAVYLKSASGTQTVAILEGN